MRVATLLLAALCAGGAQAQSVYGPRLATPATTAAPLATQAGPGALAPFCFEPMDPRDGALAQALAANGLLCSTPAGKGAPVRLVAAPGGELTGGAGPATAWHRKR